MNIGYLIKQGEKRGIENELDLTSMYKQFDNGEQTTIYCEANSNPAGSDARRKRKSPTESESDSLEDHEREVKKAAEKLKDMHGEVKYDSRQLLLWGRMIVNNQWKSYDEPPDVPLSLVEQERFHGERASRKLLPVRHWLLQKHFPPLSKAVSQSPCPCTQWCIPNE